MFSCRAKERINLVWHEGFRTVNRVQLSDPIPPQTHVNSLSCGQQEPPELKKDAENGPKMKTGFTWMEMHLDPHLVVFPCRPTDISCLKEQLSNSWNFGMTEGKKTKQNQHLSPLTGTFVMSDMVYSTLTWSRLQQNWRHSIKMSLKGTWTSMCPHNHVMCYKPYITCDQTDTFPKHSSQYIPVQRNISGTNWISSGWETSVVKTKLKNAAGTT